MTHPRRFLPLICLLLGLSLPAQAAPDALTPALDKILDAPALRGGITGAIVQRVSDGQILYARNPDTRLLPASNRKLFTSAAALELLGDRFTYTTQVLATARPDPNGTLHGDLILKGVGDSSLTTADMDELAAQVAKAGIKRVSGSVIGDGTIFTDGPYGFGWEWDDFSDSEFPQIAGLEVNDGDVTVHVVSGNRAGLPVVATLDAPQALVPLDNRAVTAPQGAPANCSVLKPYGRGMLQITGQLPLGTTATQQVPVENPSQFAAGMFARALERAGVGPAAPKPVVGPNPLPYTTMAESIPLDHAKAYPGFIVVASHTSVPLAAYIALMNKPSDNLLAESLIRTLGVVKGVGGTYDTGHAVEMPFFQRLGVDTGAIALVDGCGVGRRNFVTARAVAQLLVGMHRQADWQAYYDSLPIAGVDGTLKNRFKGTRAQGSVHAKTGTLSQVRALSGYFMGTRGDLYAFCLLMNNFPGTAHDAGEVQDRFVVYLTNNL